MLSPIDLMTAPSSLVDTVPSPSWDKVGEKCENNNKAGQRVFLTL